MKHRRCGEAGRKSRTRPVLSSATGAAARRAIGLTKRETTVVHLVAQGKSNPDIAEKLGISPETVKRHVSNILKKTARSNRTELAVYAIANKLTD